MKHFVGLDECDKIVYETTISTYLHTLADAIREKRLKIELIGLESSSLIHYLMQEFRERIMDPFT